MNLGILLLSLILSTTAFAVPPSSDTIKKVLEQQETCQNFVRFNDTALFLGFGVYRNSLEEPRSPIPSRLRVVPFDNTPVFDLATKDASIDVTTEGSRAFVLTYSSIEEWDLTSKQRIAEYPTYLAPGPFAYQQHSEALARYKNKIIIAHGRLGVSFFDLNSKRITNQYRLIKGQLPLESMATGVTVQGQYAYVVMDNFHLVSNGKPPFRGIVVIDMESEQVVAELDGMDPGATSVVSDAKKVIVNFSGRPIWKYNIATLKGKSIPAPETRIWRYPIEGYPAGSAAMDSKYYYTCYKKAYSDGGYRPVPVAMDRRVLMLD